MNFREQLGDRNIEPKHIDTPRLVYACYSGGSREYSIGCRSHVICLVQLANEMSASKKRLRKAVSCGSQRTADPGRGNGADDESTGSNSEGGGRKAEVVGGRGNNGRDGPHDAALAGAAGAERL